MTDRQPTVDELLEMEQAAQKASTESLAAYVRTYDNSPIQAIRESSFVLERLDVYRRELAHREAHHAG